MTKLIKFFFLAIFALMSTSLHAEVVELFGGEKKCGRTINLEELLRERGVSFEYRSWDDAASNQYMWKRLSEITPEGQPVKSGISPGVIVGDTQIIIPMESNWDDWQRYADQIAALAKNHQPKINHANSLASNTPVDSGKISNADIGSASNHQSSTNTFKNISWDKTTASTFVLNSEDGSIWKWSGRPHQWTQVGSSASKIAVTGNSLYAINKNNASLWLNTGAGWIHIGDGVADIAVDGSNVYVINDQDRSVWKYRGSHQKWSKVGDRAAKIAAKAGSLWVINSDNASVWHNAGDSQWTHVGDRAKDIVAGSQGVFVLNNQDHSIWKYQNTPHSWIHFGVRTKQLVQTADAIFVINQDNSSVWRNSGSGWEHVGDRAESISGSETEVFLVNNENSSVWRFDGKPHKWTHIGDSAKQVAISK